MTARHHAAQFAEALTAYQCMAAWWGGHIPLRLGSWGPGETIWRRGPASDLPELVRHLDCEYSDEIRLGIPQHRVAAGGVTCGSVLWVYVTGSDQLARARRFRPLPSLAIAEGSSSRRWLMWSIRDVMSYFEMVDGNRRLAYHFGAVQRNGDPDVAWIPAVGTCLREGRGRPVPVGCARLTTASYTLEQVVGRLKAPPEPVKWWEAS